MKNHETHRAARRSSPRSFGLRRTSGALGLHILAGSALAGSLLQAHDARAQEAEGEAPEVAQTTEAPAPVEESPVGREEPPVASAPDLNVVAEPTAAPAAPAAEPEPILKPSRVSRQDRRPGSNRWM